MVKKVVKRIKQGISSLLKTTQEKRHALVGAGNLWKMKRDFQMRFLKEQGMRKTDKLMDVGCGTLRGGIPMIEYLDNNNYFGIDVRENVLIEGRKELKTFKLEHKNPTLISFDHFSDIQIETKFNIIFAFSVLIHLADEIAENCFQFVGKSLLDDGVFFANVNIGDHQDGNWHGFPVVFRSLEFYRDLANKNGMKIEVIGNLKELGHDTGRSSDTQQIMLGISKI